MLLKTVQKRNGSIVSFDVDKIELAVTKAWDSVASELTEHNKEECIAKILRKTKNVLKSKVKEGVDINVELIQDIVEQVLFAEDLQPMAWSFKTYREAHRKLREIKEQDTGEIMRQMVFTDKYAKYDSKLKRRRTFDETIDGVKNMHLKKYKSIMTDILEYKINWAFDLVKKGYLLPAMRSMQYSGDPILKNNCRMYNCYGTLVDRLEVFSQVFYLLLCGGGVGYSVEYEHVEKLPTLANSIDEKDIKHYVIPDSIEGWATALNKLIESYIEGYYIEFSYIQIRRQGAVISSGGKAPGHIPLKNALEKIRKVLHRSLGRQLKPIECHDIMCHAADSVLAGGVRRSALLCLFSFDDPDMSAAKIGDWDAINPQRARANNSCRLVKGEYNEAQFKRIFRKTKEFGEPGFIFADTNMNIVNPCAEIILEPIVPEEEIEHDITKTVKFKDTYKTGFGCCNLTEVNGKMMTSADIFMDAVNAATIIGTLQAGYTDFGFLGETSEIIAKRDALLGVSITGIMDNPEILLDPEILQDAATEAKVVNAELAQMLGINCAKRITCVKPAGTTSIVLDTASGIHPRHANRYFRRVRFNKENNIYKFFKSINPHMCEEARFSANNVDDVVTFCIKAPEHAITRKDISALELLENVKIVQQNWVEYGVMEDEQTTNSVSNTVTVKDDEWDAVADYLWKNRRYFTGITLLGDTGDKVYMQAPFEEVTTDEDEIRWNYISSKYTPVDFTKMEESEDLTNFRDVVACSGGKCDLI